MMYVPSSPPTVEVHIDARSQFVALGVGVIVGRCGSRSHVRALTPPDLTHIGREWVVVPQSGGGINLTISQQYYDWFAHYDRHLPRNAFFTISPTLGLVSAPDLLLRGEVLAWVGRDGSETNRRRGEGPRFAVVAERNDGTLVIRDWNRDDWNTEEGEAIPLRLFERVKCNSKWIVGFDERSGVLTLRNLERLLVGSNQQNLLPVRIKMQRVVTLCFVDDNKLAVLEGTGDMWSMLSPMPCYRVTVVDLHKSYSSGSCCSVLQTGVKIPLPSSMWLSGRGHLYVCGTGSDRARCIENVTTGQMIPIVPSHGSHCDEILPLEQSRFAVVTYGCPSPVYDLTLGPRCMEESVGSVCVYSDAVVRQGIMVSAVSLRQVDVSHIATGVTIFSIHGTDDNHITIYGSSPKQSDLV
ncbi:hypothetical protein Pelo_17022 [Pelomyxa schiedti]|nr:hypothetical protein Pelo_17022 [Pelomyxa schiedti]